MFLNEFVNYVIKAHKIFCLKCPKTSHAKFLKPTVFNYYRNRKACNKPSKNANSSFKFKGRIWGRGELEPAVSLFHFIVSNES